MTEPIRTANVTKYLSEDANELLISVHHRHDNLRWQVTDFTGDFVEVTTYALRVDAEAHAVRRLS